MKILSWNIRGLNGRSKQRMSKMKIQKDRHVVLFIQETKCSDDLASKLMSRIWKDSRMIAIDARGASGGISITWNPLLATFSVATSSMHTLSASFHILGTNIKGYLMNVYGAQAADS